MFPEKIKKMDLKKEYIKIISERVSLKEDDFSFCPEATTKISNKNIKIYEVPINYKGREFSEGKKIAFKDALKAIFVLFKYKFFK